MNLKGTPGIRIVDIRTNEDVGVFDKYAKPRIKQEYIKKRLAAYKEGKCKEVK